MMEDAYNANLPANPITARRQASGDQLTTGFFIEEDWTPSGPEGRLVLTGGMRADRWAIRNGGFRATNPAGALTADTIFADRADWVVSGRAGALFHLADKCCFADPGLAHGLRRGAEVVVEVPHGGL